MLDRLVDFDDRLFRNIATCAPSQHLLDDLSNDPVDWAIGEQAAGQEQPQELLPLLSRPFSDGVGIAPGGGTPTSRFSDGSQYGVWYGSLKPEITIYETVYHWQNNLLDDAGFNRPGVEIQRRIYMVQCDSLLIDLRPEIKSYPEILHATDYSATQTIGRKLHREGHPGLITHSARVKHGDNYAIFTPKVLSNPAHTCYLTYRTTATGVEVERTMGQVWMTILASLPAEAM